MRLLRLEAEDFLAYDSLELDLGGIDELAIVGPVGAGKSSLLDMVLWSLWGQQGRGTVRVNDLIRHGQTSCRVQTTWELADGRRLEVIRRRSERGRGESSLSITLAGEDLTRHTISETQEVIDQIVGVRLGLLLAGPVMVQGKSDELMRLDPAQRKELLVQLLDLHRYRVLAERVRDRLTSEESAQANDERLVEELADKLEWLPSLEADLQIAQEDVATYTTTLESWRAEVVHLSKMATARDEQRRQADQLHAEIDRLETALVRLEKRSQALAADWETRSAVKRPKKVKLVTAADCEELARYAVDKARYDDAQEWLRHSYTKLADLIEGERADVTGTLGAYRQKLELLSASEEATKSLEAELHAAQGQATAADAQLREATERVGRLTATRAEFTDMKKRLEAGRRRLHSRTSMIASLKLLGRAYGRDGIPTMVLEQSIPQIEERANEVLAQMPSGFQLTLRTQRETLMGAIQDTLDVVLATDGFEQSYVLGSGGERMQVDFALRVALSSLFGRFSTLWIDEGWGSQDAAGRTAMVDAIRMVTDDFGLVVAVSHVEDVADQFPHRLEVRKAGGVSSVRMA